jgi:C-terminal processing protease CtpA/Prc
VIIDARSNGGGYYLFPEHLTAMFMPPDTDTYFILHIEEHQAFLDDGGSPAAPLVEMARSHGQVIRPLPSKITPYAGPVAVLVDRRTGSAGETFAASVKAAGRGVVIGTRTAGTVLSGNNRRQAPRPNLRSRRSTRPTQRCVHVSA